MHSFEFLTGPKQDIWLVRTVGAMVTVIGGSIALCAGSSCRHCQNRRLGQARILWLNSALVLAAIDTIYAAKGRISKIYLARRDCRNRY